MKLEWKEVAEIEGGLTVYITLFPSDYTARFQIWRGTSFCGPTTLRRLRSGFQSRSSRKIETSIQRTNSITSGLQRKANIWFGNELGQRGNDQQ